MVIKLKNRLINLLFGSIERQLLFIFSSFVFVFVFLDVSQDVISYGITWFISNLLHNFILLIFISLILSLFLLKNKFDNLLKSLKLDLISTPILFLTSLFFLPHVLSIIILLYFFIERKVKYILTICQDVKIISEGNLEHKIEVKGHDELSALAAAINNNVY